MAGDDGGRNWLRCGCFGCLGVVVFVVVVLVAIFGTAKIGASREQVAERVFEPAIPSVEASVAATGVKPGRVVLRLTSGEFYIKPARKGESLRVDARYDEKTYEIRERLDPGGETWTYEIDFERKGGMVMSLLRGLMGGTGSRVEIFLPPDVPLDIEIVIHQGGGEIDLGGLWLKEADIEVGQGGFALQFGDPLREPMDRLSIHGSMGGFAAQSVGNASPRKLDVECSMGGMDLDLRGYWVVDSEITIRTSQGGGQVRLPRDVEIVGLETIRSRPRADEEVPLPTLTFTVSSNRGELEIVE